MMSAPAPYPTVQLSAPAPDDHQISSRTPSICVDYLSHNWTDEDVWSSWKAMTKRKNEIANGVRLENASWRTWAKQRGKLKTISPETLNWLKDSDVTWLYGPLHEHAEPVPPPKIASAQERLDLDDSVRTKSILKHRTISEMLTTPGRSASPIIEYPYESADNSREGSDTEMEPIRDSRPSFFAVRSDSNLAQRKRQAGGSPPAHERLFQNLAAGVKEDGLSHPPIEERRHISFNQRVDQCIAVDVIEDDDRGEEEDDGYSDDMYEGEKRSEEEEDTPSSEEEVLTMKSSPRISPSWPLTRSSSQGSSPTIEHQTIAKLAPTLLKTSDIYPAPSPQVVDPTGFTGLDSVGSEPSAGEGGAMSAQPQSYRYGEHRDDDGASQTRYSQWDADDDFNGDFDYFNGPDMSDNYEQSHLPSSVDKLPKDEVAIKAGSKGNESEEQSSPGETASAPRSILKKSNLPPAAPAQEDTTMADDEAINSPVSPRIGAPSSPNSSNEGRGRSSQRLGSSASYERVQDASRGASGAAPSGAAASNSNSGNNRARSNSYNSSGSADGAITNTSSASGYGGANTSAYASSERRDSFRGKAGDGSRAMGAQSDSSYASVAASPSSSRKKVPSSAAIDSDSDGRGSFDFNSPGYPASPLLGERNEAGDASHEASEANLYGRRKDSTKWADRERSAGSKGKNVAFSGQHVDEEEEPARLSVDLDNLPSNTSPNHSAQGGPTPLNTPTFSLARSRAKQSRSGGSSQDPRTSKGPDSPTMPRRSSAMGALVAPSDADKDAGVRVPLAHDYVEEDEGGIVGRAVEIVNTARDLIGALLGTGGDRGRSWRESY